MRQLIEAIMSDYIRVKDAIHSISAVITDATGRSTKKAGSQLFLEECPFCKGHNCFNIRESQGAWHCFQCGDDSGGDVFTFLEQFYKEPKVDALKRAAAIANITLEVKGERKARFSRAEKVKALAADYYHGRMLDNGGKVYLTETRGHDLDVLKREKIGWSDGKLLDHLRGLEFTDEEIIDSGLAKIKELGEGQFRILDFFSKGLVIFPHFSAEKVVHFTMKDPDKKIAYQLPNDKRGKGWIFYGQDSLDHFQEIILVEGENDRLQVLNSGMKNVMAMIGQISDDQIKALGNRCRGKHLYLWVDNDQGGDKYIRKICSTLPEINIRILVYGAAGDDPDSFLKSLPAETVRKPEIQKLLLDSIDFITWEISQAGMLETIEEKSKHLKDYDVFKMMASRGEMEQLIYMEKLERLGFTRKSIEQALDFSQELYTRVAAYFESHSAKDADPNAVAAIIYKYFSENGRFYWDAANIVWLIYKNKTYEVSNNTPFNALMHKLTKLLFTRSPGGMVWDALKCTAYNNGRRIDRAQWVHTDDVRGIIWCNLNGPNNTILRVSADGIKEITNGMNDDHVLLSSSSEIMPFNFLPDADIQEGLTLFKELVMDNMACEKKQRYFIASWLMSAFLTDFSSVQGHMKFAGSAGSGKSTTAELISSLLYGKDSLEDPTGAAAYSMAAQNPLLVIDNLESKDLTRTMQKFLLLAATRGGKAKRASGSDSAMVKERPRALICITAIEPFTLPELISRIYDIWFDRRKFPSPNFYKAETFRQLKKKRDLILSAMIKFIQSEVLCNIERLGEYMSVLNIDYPGHSKDRTNEYLALLSLILNRLLKYIPLYSKDELLYGMKDDTGKYEMAEKEIRDAWIAEQNAKSKDTEVTSNNILKLFDGLVREYMMYFKGQKLEPEPVIGYPDKVFKIEHPEYGLTLFKTVPEDKLVDGERFETSTIEFVAQSKEIVYALDRFCRNNGLRNPYPEASVFGARLQNDMAVLEKGGWKLCVKEGKEGMYWKKVNGNNYLKFQHVWVR
jgi:DNA primase